MALAKKTPQEVLIGVKNPKVLLVYVVMDESTANTTHDIAGNTAFFLRPLLGFQYLAAISKTIGVETAIWDQRIMKFDVMSIAKYIEEHDIMLVGFYTSFALTENVCDFVAKLRYLSSVPIMVGGPGYVEYKDILEAGADLVCNGEGEEIFVNVIKSLKSGDTDWSKIDGLYWKNGDEVVANKAHIMVQNLDDLPFPERDSINIYTYRDYYLLGFRYPYVSMMTTRGCPYRCTFCDTHNVWKKEVRHRSPDNCINEIDMLVKKYGVRYIDMVDDVFGVRHEWVEEFGRKLAQRKYDLHYKILVNPSTFGAQQAKAFEWLAASGCDSVGIGMQTADKNTLKAINRGKDDFTKLKRLIEITNKKGMMSFVSFIAGFPEEPDDAPQQIMRVIDDVGPTVIDCYPLVYLKGTDLEKKYSRGEIKDTYPYPVKVDKALSVKRHFYKQIHRVLNIFKWIFMNNPGWLVIAILQHPGYVAGIVGFTKRKNEDVETAKKEVVLERAHVG
jgi:anaerobic magnesium-protoporphyrin IX monomethyl ester cyclase